MYTPTKILCDKMARLWRIHMDRPKFDQLGDSRMARATEGEIGREALCQVMVTRATKDTTTEQLDAFEKALSTFLMTEYPFRSCLEGFSKDTREYLIDRQWVTDLRVDYDPCNSLRAVIKQVGLPMQQLPIKSSTVIDYGNQFVSGHFGYGAPTLNYYHLDRGQWLLTSLQGNDTEMETVKNFALKFPDAFRIE